MDPIRVPPEMFRFTSGDLSGLYTAILHAFGEANERLETALGLDDLRARLPGAGLPDLVDTDDLAAALDQLRRWDLVDVVQNHSENYRTAVDYERRNLLYSLTKQGEAAFAGVVHAMTVLASSGALQTAVLDAIGDRLADLVRELDGGTDRRVFTVLMELEAHLEALRVNTKQFNGELQRLLRAEGVDLAVFHEVKAATVAYLQEFLDNLDRRGQLIAGRVRVIEEFGVSRMYRRALAGAELPALPGSDPAPGWLEQRHARWAGLQAWFSPVDGSAPRIDQLRQVGRRAIVTLLQVLDRITESRRRSSNAVTDFRELARWFSVLPEEADLHRLWSTAFGLAPARHAHLAHPDPELISHHATWAESPPVEVSALLRTAGKNERLGRTGTVPDVSALRKERAARAVAERVALQQAWARLHTHGVRKLSEFAELEPAMAERLLDLIGRALGSAPDAVGIRRSTTPDGRIEIALGPAEPGAVAEVHTVHGLLRGPDYALDVRQAGRRAGR